jgi:Zn-dependent protease with chaperone function
MSEFEGKILGKHIWEAAGFRNGLPAGIAALPKDHEFRKRFPESEQHYSYAGAAQYLDYLESIHDQLYYIMSGHFNYDHKYKVYHSRDKHLEFDLVNDKDFVDREVEEARERHGWGNSIYKRKARIGSTFSEALSIGTLYICAAGAVCLSVTGAITAGAGLINPASIAIIVGTHYLARRTLPYLFTKRVDVAKLSEADKLKIYKVKRDITAMAKAAGKEIADPPIRIMRTRILNKLLPAGTFKGWRGYEFAFGTDFIENNHCYKIKAVAGHEVAHRLLNHLEKRSVVVVGMLSTPLDPVTALIATAFLTRRFEFQADRVGAVLSGSPKLLKEALEDFGLPEGPPMKFKSKWAKHVAGAGALAADIVTLPMRLYWKMVYLQHPNLMRRLHRLERIGAPNKPFENLRHDLKHTSHMLFPGLR